MREDCNNRWDRWENRAGLLFKGSSWTTPPRGEGVWSVLPKRCGSAIGAPRRHIGLLSGLKIEGSMHAETRRYSLLDLTTICLQSPYLSPSDETFFWTTAKATDPFWAGWWCGDRKQTWIIRVKSLLLPLCPARPMVIKQTCRWDPRASSYSPGSFHWGGYVATARKNPNLLRGEIFPWT